MYRKILCLVVALSFLGCTYAFAGGAGNCTQPLRKTTKYLGAGAAFEYNYVGERMNDLDNKSGPKSMTVEHISQVYGKVSVGLFDYFNIYGKIGGSNYDLKFVDRPMDATMEIKLHDGLYTGGGINALLPITEMKNLTLGIGADIQGNFYYNSVKEIIRGGQNATGIGGSFYGIDGQNSLYLTCKYDIEKLQASIIPYVGGYHSWIVVGTLTPLTYETRASGYVDKKHFNPAFDVLSFGLLVGVDLDIAKFINLNVEGRFIGETALTTGATIKF